MLTIADRASPNAEVVVTELEGEAVLLHLGTKRYYSLNATGLRIWKLFATERTLDAISVRLQEAFDIAPERAQESVLRLAGELQAERLIDVVRD